MFSANTCLFDKLTLMYASVNKHGRGWRFEGRGWAPSASRDERPSGGAPTLSGARPARVRGECTRCAPRVPRPLLHRKPLNFITHLDPIYDSMALTSRRRQLSSHYPDLEHPPAENRYQRDAAHLSHKIQPTSLLTSSLTKDCAKVAIFHLVEHIHSLRSNVKTLFVQND